MDYRCFKIWTFLEMSYPGFKLYLNSNPARAFLLFLNIVYELDTVPLKTMNEKLLFI